jgi:ABC-type transporter Mla subunit MlaD
MSTRRNTTAIYVIAFVVIIVAFLLLGGGTWIREMMQHGSRSIGMDNLNWAQILISLGLGFLLGWIVSRRKW